MNKWMIWGFSPYFWKQPNRVNHPGGQMLGSDTIADSRFSMHESSWWHERHGAENPVFLGPLTSRGVEVELVAVVMVESWCYISEGTEL